MIMEETQYTVKHYIDYEIVGNGDLRAWGQDVSDGYHTMTELYNHRHALFCALCKIYDNYITPLNSRVTCWKSILHNDGTMYPGWFIAGMTIKQFDGTFKHLSYHLPIDWWDKFKVMEYRTAPEWDGHTSDDVLVRLMEL